MWVGCGWSLLLLDSALSMAGVSSGMVTRSQRRRRGFDYIAIDIVLAPRYLHEIKLYRGRT